MKRPLLCLALISLPFAAACASSEPSMSDPVGTDPKASVETQELDPNDPNVEQCPVTGALQLKSDSGKSSH